MWSRTTTKVRYRELELHLPRDGRNSEVHIFACTCPGPEIRFCRLKRNHKASTPFCFFLTDQTNTTMATEALPATTGASSGTSNQTTLRTSLVASDASQELTSYNGYDNVHWYVGNAKQVASFYVTRMGFQRVAFRGLETGSRVVASHVVRNGNVTFIFTSPLLAPDSNVPCSKEDEDLLDELHTRLAAHGDAVRDVAFEVNDVDAVYRAAISNGAKDVYSPKELSDEFGTVKIARIRTYGDTTHTLIQRGASNGAFLPGFRAVSDEDPISKYLPAVKLDVVDHCVGNQDWNEMEAACE